jgi:Domain of unknown function (DUF4158)
VKQDWDEAELSRWWSLNFDELALVETKPPRTRLGFATQLKIYRLAGRFAEHTGEFRKSLSPILQNSSRRK